ncbi:AAA family ATPase [Allokutzneria sp. NRRL B-24872]|uniref:helix-turn-helix transcriptional regulator n=1 Tax=Allokutzneria sp. NRRL B-24872 TaxID=1137961 RepID=UPI000A3BA1CC|nr:AAA family ATPase [Allokutzneria sp. NRRL B-24872]
MLLERQNEVSTVAGALRRARAGAGSLLVVSGPIGIGKTQLLRSLPELVGEGTTVLRASGSLLERHFAFGVVRQLLDPVLASATDAERERWLGATTGKAEGVIVGEGDCSHVTPATVAAVLRDLEALVTAISADRSLLVLVDDLHWVDLPSLRWLAYVAKRLNGVPVTIVGTVREGDPLAGQALLREITASAARVLRPRPLSPTGTAELVLEQFGEHGDDEFVLACHEICDGNPMFLMSVLVTMVFERRRPIASEAGFARTTRPAKLRERLTSYLTAQPEPVRDYLTAMAALGENTDPELVAALAGLDRVGGADAARIAGTLGLFAAGPDPVFAHPVVREAIDESLSTVEREKLHMRAAELLHSRGHAAEQVAAHLLVVTARQECWGTEVLRTAAQTALQRGAPEVAARYLQRALIDHPADDAHRAALLVDLAMAERVLDPAAAVRHVSQAVPLLPSVWDRAAALVRLAPSVLDSAPLPIGELMRSVADEVGDPDELTGPRRDLALRLEARLRHSSFHAPEGLISAAERLEQMGPRPPLDTGAERELAAVLLFAAAVRTTGTAVSLAASATRILECEPATISHVHTALPLLAVTLAGADAAKPLGAWLDSAYEQARLRGSTVSLAWIKAEQAVVRMRAGDLTEARSLAKAALELAELEWGEAVSLAVTVLSLVALETEDLELAEWLLVEVDGQNGDGWFGFHRETIRHMLHGARAMAGADFSLAADHFLSLGRCLDQAGWTNAALHAWRSWAAEAYRRMGELDRARELIETEHALAVSWGAPAAAGRTTRMRGVLRSGVEGIRIAREAARLLESSEDRLELAKALVDLGAKLREAGESGAAGYLTRGRELANDCGAAVLAERAWDELSSVTADPGSAPVQRARPAALTKTERLVAELAAQGRTNKDIADELGVGGRAVEKHLTNIYRKLCVRGRSGLVAALRSGLPG